MKSVAYIWPNKRAFIYMFFARMVICYARIYAKDLGGDIVDLMTPEDVSENKKLAAFTRIAYALGFIYLIINFMD